MQLPHEGTLLRILVGEADKVQGKPRYEWIVLQAREQGLAGATVLRGMMRFGANTRRTHTFRFETLSEDLPVVVEIVDTTEKLEQFLERIAGRERRNPRHQSPAQAPLMRGFCYVARNIAPDVRGVTKSDDFSRR